MRTVGRRIIPILYGRLTGLTPMPELYVAREDELLQRAVRASFACALAVAGVRHYWLAAPGTWVDPILSTRPEGGWWILATVMFYLYDTSVLVWYGSKDTPMYMHHVGCVFGFSLSLLTNTWYGAAMILLPAEFLVPWGALLHWMKCLGFTNNRTFVGVIAGGLSVLLFYRLPTDVYLFYCFYQYRASFLAAPLVLSSYLVAGAIVAVYLDITWSNLYLQNLRNTLKSFAKSSYSSATTTTPKHRKVA